jgi:siroheme synthase (precorrin-2 oxidase/ferrochelatase)
MDAGVPGYPVSLSLRDRLAVIVGDGSSAEALAASLARCGAKVRVVTPVTPAWVAGIRDVEAVPRAYVRGDLEGALLAFALGQSAEVEAALAAEAADCGCLIDLPGDASSSDFHPLFEPRRGVAP